MDDYIYQPLSVTEENADEQVLIKDGTLTAKKPVPIEAIERNHLENKTRSSFDRVFLRRFFRLLKILFSVKTPEGNCIFICFMLMLTSAINEILAYFVGKIPSKFYTTLVGIDGAHFKTLLVYSTCIVLLTGLGRSIMYFVGGLFELLTRKVLTRHLQNKYVKPDIFYRILITRHDRITQDVDNFSKSLRIICQNTILAPFLIIYYTYLTWNISGYLGPLIIYLYFIFSLFACRFLINPISKIIFLKEFHEGNFRFLHVRIRQFAESIAFSWGEKVEEARLSKFFDSVLNYQRQRIDKELVLRSLTESVAYFGSILSYLIISIPIFLGEYDDTDKDVLSGLISLNAFFTLYLIGKFTSLIEESTNVSNLAGFTARIGQLLEALDDVNDDINGELNNINIKDQSLDPREATGEFVTSRSESSSIIFDQVTFDTPSGATLLKDLEIVIEQGKNLMLIGPNGSGKTSILRVMCGLWPTNKGQITRPKMNMNSRQHLLVYLPQVPYLVYGSLRDQITYPVINDPKQQNISDQELNSLLEKVELTHLKSLIQNYDSRYGEDWNRILSPGEQQKLSFARLLYWKPLYAG
ncbi:17552_t:CDS:10 [Entrophospora sp. SA101]|nr:17552_t:CDS:10 [Entrophospora sp. SA101]